VRHGALSFVFSGLLVATGCSSSQPSAGPHSPDAGTTGSSRMVSACSQCSSTEICVDVEFSDGPCEGSGSGASGTDCPKGSSFDGDCCQVDPSDTYHCYPTPSGCASPVTCECAANVVIDACSGEVLSDVDCAEVRGGLSCEQSHD
jgi:hypothetical protein